MRMIEKLIQDTKEIQADSKKSEADAQAACEATIADMSASAQVPEENVVCKAMSKAKKERRNEESDLDDTMKELE
eukprot:1039187-Heterocapsa_arctica.AAC.1